jgi:hypothetical protein
MAHKDWDGPGWYDRWLDDEQRDGCYEFVYDSMIVYDSMSNANRYTKRSTPKPPKKELPDGLYFYKSHIASSKAVYQSVKTGGEWAEGYCKLDDNDEVTILGRIPVEPVK